MISNGRRWGIIVAAIGVAVAALTSGLVLRVVGAESKEGAAAVHDAIKTEINGRINAIELRHADHERGLHEIERKVDVQGAKVEWIQEALRDAGYRAPKLERKP